MPILKKHPGLCPEKNPDSAMLRKFLPRYIYELFPGMEKEDAMDALNAIAKLEIDLYSVQGVSNPSDYRVMVHQLLPDSKAD